jgi:hypothetical protein
MEIVGDKGKVTEKRRPAEREARCVITAFSSSVWLCKRLGIESDSIG